MKAICDLSVTSGPCRPRPHWQPGRLFGDGAKGVWYDPSDLSSLFQDADGNAAGMQPGSPVGRMQDKSGTLLHAVQSGSARPTYSVTPASGRRSLATISEPTNSQLSLSLGVSDAATAIPGFDHAIAVPGGAVGDRLSYVNSSISPSTVYTLSCFVVMDDGGDPVPLSDFALVVGNKSSGSDGYYPPVNVGAGVWRVARTLQSLSTGNMSNTGVWKSDNHSPRGFRVSGFQIETGVTMTAYQRARSAFDLREDGVASLAALDFDGVDDAMFTGTLDLTHTSQVTVVAGVEKFSEPASRGTIVNFVDNGFQNFSLEMPQPSSTSTRWLHAGPTTLVAIGAASPGVNARTLYTGISDLAAPRIELRENGVSVGTNVGPTGGGPFKSGPLGIGDYVVPSGRHLHGRLFGLLVIDRMLTPQELGQVENWFITKTGAGL